VPTEVNLLTDKAGSVKKPASAAARPKKENGPLGLTAGADVITGEVTTGEEAIEDETALELTRDWVELATGRIVGFAVAVGAGEEADLTVVTSGLNKIGITIVKRRFP
jgi:hypothetical protein